MGLRYYKSPVVTSFFDILRQTDIKNLRVSAIISRKSRIFAAEKLRERAVPQQLEYVPLRSVCTVLAP